MNKFRSSVLILLSLSLFCACARSYLPTKYYRINTTPKIEKSQNNLGLSILIEDIISPSFYATEMVYQITPYEVSRYQYSQWTEPPGVMIRASIINSLLAADIFTRLDSPADTQNSDLTLRGELLRFDQIIEEDNILVHCWLGLEIIDNRSGKLVWKFSFNKKISQEKEGTFAETMSKLMDEAMKQMVVSLCSSSSLSQTAQRAAVPQASP